MIELSDYLNPPQIEYFYDHLYLLKEDNYDRFYDFYDQDPSPFTALFFDCDINPLEYMTYVPNRFAYELDMESIKIHEGITKISKFSFSDCKSLKKITILNPDCYIERLAFDGVPGDAEFRVTSDKIANYFKSYGYNNVMIIKN